MTALENRLNAYEKWLCLNQPVGFFLLLWPTLSALWLATHGQPPLSLVLIFAMMTLLMRSAGCAFTVWHRRNNHHLPSPDSRSDSSTPPGNVAPWEALIIAFVLLLMTLCFVWFITRTATILFAATLALALVFVLLHPFFKRLVTLPKAFPGFAFSLGIPMAFAATDNTVPWYAWALMGVNVFWVMAYDIQHAMANREKENALGRRSSAFALGRCDVLTVALCYILHLTGMIGIGLHLRLGIAYGIAVALAVVSASISLWLIRNRDPSRCATAFRHSHWIGMILFIGIVVDHLLRMNALPLWSH